MKEKRKTRLDKGTSSDFIGFNAFGAPAAAASPFATAQATTASSGGGVTWSPIYTGSDSTVQTAFSWLTSKRDSVTHVKALQSLTTYIAQDDVPKKLQAAVVQHWIWLYHRKVYFDATAAVRAAALQLWVAIRQRLPKAFSNLVANANAAATASTDATVVLGMLYSTLVDAATEVQAVAQNDSTQQILFAELAATSAATTTTAESGADDRNDAIDWQGGIMAFCNYILSCGRHSVFYEKLLQGKKSTQTSSYADLGDEQKDNVLETYTRVTANVLDTLVYYIRHHHSQQQQRQNTTEIEGQEQQIAETTLDTQVWYKTLHSSHANLRQRTYAVVSAVASHRSETLGGLPTNNSLAQSLSSEKEPANWPALLEALLAVTLASDTKQIATAYVNPLCRAWKKACYGANMTTAGPMLLPLSASMPTPTDTWKLLQAAWEGRDLTLGGTDKWRKIQAIAECFVFGLLRKQTTTTTSDGSDMLSQYHMEWLHLYGQILLEALGTDPSNLTGTTLVAHEDLLKSLGQQLPRIEMVLCRQVNAATSPSPVNALEFLMGQHSVETILESLLPLQEDKESARVAPISSKAVSIIMRHSGDLLSPDESPFIPVFRKVFERFCPRKASGDVPSLSCYEALEILMDSIMCQRLFDMDGSSTMEKFVMNDLLRWVIIHTSLLAVGQSQNEFFVQADFRLLYRCLGSLEATERKQQLWEPFLREIVAAKCDIKWLTVALQTLLGKDKKVNSLWIQCPVLDNFVKGFESQADAAEEESEHSGEESFDERNAMTFLGLCCGISSISTSDPPLIDPQVVKYLAREICSADHLYGSRPSPIERTLLKIVRVNRSDLLDKTEENKLLLHAWTQGSHRLVEDLLSCLADRTALGGEFVASASAGLKHDMQDLDKLSGREYQRKVRIWASKASDLFMACTKAAVSDDAKLPSLSLLGLSDPGMWKSQSKVLFDISMAVFEHFPDSSRRFSLLSNSTDIATTDLLVSILLALSEATSDLVGAQSVSRGMDRSARFLGSLGGAALDGGFVELCVRDTVKRLVSHCKDDSTNPDMYCRHVAVISQLVSALFRPLNGPKSGTGLSAESIKAGDQLWYVTDPAKPDELVPATVVKAHFDAEAGYYFSISIKNGSETQERQTVVSRLRKARSDVSTDNGVDPESLSEDEKSQRNAIRDVLLRSIVFPYFKSLPWESCVAELANVAVSHVGIGESRGLGSSHYELFRLLKTEVATMTTALAEKQSRVFEGSAWKISLACGFGLTVPSCLWITRAFSLDPPSIVEVLLSDFPFRDNGPAVTSALSLCTTLSRCTESNLVDKYTSFASGLIKQKFEADLSRGFTGDTFLALRLLNQTISDTKDSENILDYIDGPISLLFRAFVSSWKNPEDETKTPIWAPHIEQTIDVLAKKQNCKSLMGTVAASLAEDLTSCMFLSCKQHLAFRLLEAVSDRKDPLRDESSILLAPSTESRIKEWTAGLSEEEASEVMQDIEIVSQWLPLSMMTEIEKWQDETFENIDEGESVGRFLVWLTTLNMIHAAAPINFRNRPAFVSFLKLTASSNSILNRAILFEPHVNDPKTSKSPPATTLNAVVRAASDANAENLSSIVLFRTAEVLPSLCRRWWEEECPKVYITGVQNLVEKQIAPAILSRELGRVRSSSDLFGDMNVSGSPATREVTAMYVQDDFTLKVLIQLPSTFPLRSAQVDCSKTLGVPQTRWKRWSLQITQMLNNQGGTLQDALLLWKDNVDKEFDGIEPCPVCYSVLHVKTHKLPSLECTVCHNRFHTDCLQQWFRSSGKSQCVLCQQDWRGTRVG